MSWTRLTLPRSILVLVLCLCVTAAARGEEHPAVGPWTEAVVQPAPPASLSDLRSPTMEHELRVASGGELTLGSERLGVALVSEGRRLTWTRKGRSPKSAKSPNSGSLALPGVLTLPDVGGKRYAVALRAADDGTGVLAASAYGVKLSLDKEAGILVDSDRDGVLGSDGDGYVAPRSRTVGPWRGEAWTERGGFRFRSKPDGSWERAAIQLPVPRNRDHAAAWCLLQWRRQQCGVLPVRYDRVLEAAMRKHAEYLHMNDVKTHGEDKALPGYSIEGERSGNNSILGFGDRSMLTALQMHLATLYHRTRPLQPGLTHTAIVFHKGIFLLNVFERRGGPLANAVLVCPPHGMRDVPVRFHEEGEHPMPVPLADLPKSRVVSWGTAVNVFSEPLRLANTLGETPVLELTRGKRRRRVETFFHFPGNPPSGKPGPSNRGNIAHVPKKPLKGRTRYDAHARIVLPGGRVFDYRWWFTTAR